MLAHPHPHARSKRPRSPSPTSSPNNHSPLDELIKRRRSGRPSLERATGTGADEEWAGIERRRHRMWERAQEPAGPSRLPAEASVSASTRLTPTAGASASAGADHWATPAPSRAYHSLANTNHHHHHHHQRQHQVSSSPIRPAEDANAPTYSPFGDVAHAHASTSTNAYRESGGGYFDLRTPGSPVASPTPVPGPWDSPYAGSNALLHQLHLARLAGPQATPLSLSPLILSPQPRLQEPQDDVDHEMEMDTDEAMSVYEDTNRMLGELDRIRRERWASGQ